jgi:eukaryotic-like serine/threonine-protein kinase
MSMTTQRATWLLAGRYRIEEVIGRGGMGTVYRAIDGVLGRRVAVKVLLAELAERDPTYVVRFQREARAAAALRHPAVVKIYDSGTDQDSHYIVMEYVAGRGLEEVIREGRTDALAAAGISAQVAEAVAAAHAAGILHRDIKPANVMVRDDGGVKVLDFGIARTVQETTITRPAFALGTAAYMPPERVLGRRGDERSDIYALGCLLYALLTGHPPFTAEEPLAILHQHVHADPVPPSKAGARVPPGMERLILRMLAKDPADRPRSAGEVASLLGMAAAATKPMAIAPVGAPSAVARPSARADRRKRPVVALALAAAAILVVALVALGGSGAKRTAGPGGSAVGSRIGAQTGRVKPRVATAHRATPQHTTPAATTSPASNPAPAPAPAPPAPAPAKKAKPLKPPKPRKPPKHVPPGHGGIPPGQVGKPEKGGHKGHKGH